MKNKILIPILSIILILNVALFGITINNINRLNNLESNKSIVSIVNTNQTEEAYIYTIYYSDGSTDILRIENGKNGVDGKNLSILDVYSEYVKEYGSISYADFLKSYLSIELNNNDSKIINSCLRSVGKIYTEFNENQSTYPGMTNSTKLSVHSGACVIYKIDTDFTYFITNYHVIYNKNDKNGIAEGIHVYLYGSEQYPTEEYDENGNKCYNYGTNGISCEYVGGSINYDIAIVKAPTANVLKVNSDIEEVKFADNYYVGETAIAIGNPNDEGVSVTKGIVSIDNDNINLSIDSTVRSYRSIRIDTALYSGNSGGGLFNQDGYLIGIANAGNSTEQNINYAIPIQIVKNACDNIMYYYNDNDDNTNGLYKISLGIKVTAQTSKYIYDSISGYGKIVEEILIVSVIDNTIASNMGLEDNSIIKSIIVNNTEYTLSRYYEIGDLLLTLKANDHIKINYTINNEAKSASYTIKATDLALA